jgi:hypothetical protein
MPEAIMTTLCLPARRIAQALLAAYAAPDYVPHGLGLRFDDIQTVAPDIVAALGLTADNPARMTPATQSRLVSLLAARILD